MVCQWTHWKVYLGEGICRVLGTGWRARDGEPCPANLPEIVLTH